ncbi:mitofusin-1-like [Asterias rubens]|uniref:mitofusin-1-like n=1 Tax=Asterias rubens TaxID=7604 RepID=UPI0014558A5B|nr:mitofusin-1-like [Asterias rubens]
MATFDGTSEESDSAKRIRQFAVAKESMKKIYEKDMSFVQSMLEIVADHDFPRNCFTEHKKKLKELRDKIKRICGIIGRGKMKAVFFGMTSSGKSAVINALLRDNVVPSQFGETTAGFIVVEGTDYPDAEAQVDMDGFVAPITMEEVGKRTNVLDTGRVNCHETTVYWPKDKCKLLHNELVLIDCPGTCTTSATDKQVTKYCEDADIYIFVVNSISSLNEAAQDFFKRVAKYISKPTVLIVFTWWDQAQVAMSKTVQEEVLGQHTERATELLRQQLKVVETNEQAAKRIFFTSPVEILKTNKGSLPEDWQKRQEEFHRFEDTFKEFVSTSAIETKFKGHYEEGLRIVENAESLRKIMIAELQKSKGEKKVQLQSLETEIHNLSVKTARFVDGTLLFVNLSTTRIVQEKSKKDFEDAKEDIKRGMTDGVNDLDENDCTCFQKKLQSVALKRTDDMEKTLKSVIKLEQDELKACVEELFQESFPDINVIRNVEGGHRKVEIDYSDVAEVSGRGISVGSVDQWFGVSRKFLSSAPLTWSARYGPVITGLGAAATVAGGVATAVTAGGAAVVVSGVALCGYGIKSGLDWNKNRLENELRQKSADNAARFMESKLDDFQKKCPGVMERFRRDTVQPYLDSLNIIERRLKHHKSVLIDEISQMGILSEKVEKIQEEMRKTEKNLSDFNEQFLLKASSLTRTIKAVKQFLSPDNEHENKSMYMTEID